MPHPTPELLLPAGSLDKMRAAYDFGADAVYAGQPRYSLRARNNEFRLEQIGIGIAEAHARGKKFFVTSNLLPHNDKVRTYLRDIEPVIAMKPDALIMADPGLIMLVRERWPQVPIHLSVQANTTNTAAVKFWQRMGVARIILSRELGLDEVAQIRQDCPDMEIEVFVHGALCIAYSGRCLLSGYFNRRDPNQGTCTNACRWSYATHSAGVDGNTGEAVALAAPGAATAPGGCGTGGKHGDSGSASGPGGAAGTRPPGNESPSAAAGQPIAWLGAAPHAGASADLSAEASGLDDGPGSHIMNSKDLRAVEQVAQLTAIGVDSLKVEGRTKSLYYVARTAQVYRQAIDDAVAGRAFNPALLRDLEGLSNRGYTAGLLEQRPADDYQNYDSGFSANQRSRFVGEVRSVDGGWAEIETKNHFAVGDLLEVIHPSGNTTLRLTAMRSAEGQPLTVAQGHPVRVWIPLPERYAGALLAQVFEPGA
ncbi:MAG: U32 family peptidase C-terminal domain-containing protein [Simplicispira sp.]|nr:U32 family peptidase C-terminal domain-containing protein [Simplicispira sp.]